MKTETTWAEARKAVADLHKTLDLVQHQLRGEPDQSSPFTGTIFEEMFGKK